MGEAKRRGTFEERKAMAIAKARLLGEEKGRAGMEIQRRKPTPNQVALMATLAALSYPYGPQTPPEGFQ